MANLKDLIVNGSARIIGNLYATLKGNADTATKLETARTIRTNLGSTSAVGFDGSANVTPGIQGTLGVANGGTGQTSVANIQAGKDGDGNVISTTYVKLTGNQTIAGFKYLLNTLFIREGGTYSDTPASTQMYGQLRFQDSTGKSTGVIDNYTDTNGTTHIRLYAYLPTDTSKYSIIDLSVDKNGNWNTYAPTPATSDNSTKIATTAFVKNQGYIGSSDFEAVHTVIETYQNGADWYRIYDDGWVEQGGNFGAAYTSYTQKTFTFLKPFLNIGYFVTCHSAHTGDLYYPSIVSKTPTTVTFYGTYNNGGYGDWYACGYGA